MDLSAPTSLATPGVAHAPLTDAQLHREDERRYRRLADAGVCGVIIWSLDGPLLDANDEFLRLSGYTRDDLENGRLDWRSMTPPEYAERDRLHVAALVEHGMHEPYEKEYVRKDGSRVPVLVGSACFEGTRERGISFILDLTRQRVAADRTARLQRVAAALGEALTPAAVAALVVREGCDALGAAASFVSRMSPGRTALEIAHAEGFDPALVAQFARIPLDADVPLAVAARTAKPLWIHDLAEYDPDDAWRLRDSLPVHAVLPLVAEGEVLGVIGFSFAAPRTIELEQRVFLEALSQMCAQSFRRADLFEAERRARAIAERAARRATALQTVTAVLAGARTQDDVADAVLQTAFPVLGASRGSVGILSPDGSTLEFIGLIGYPADVAARYARVPIEAAFPPADAAREGIPILLGSAAERRERYPHLGDLRHANGDGAMAALPLVVDGRVTGALGFNFGGDREFDVEEEAFLLALARQCAQALERARLVAAEAATLARAARLQTVTAALSRAAAPRDVVEVIVREGLDALEADAGFVGRYASAVDGSDVFELAASRGLGEEIATALDGAPIAEGAAPDEALRQRHPVWLASRTALVAGWPPLAASASPGTCSCWVLLPLVAGGDVHGLLGIGFRRARRFTREDRALGEALAERCAQALDRARLLEAERRARAEADERQRRARAEADERQRRASFLAEASRALAASLEVDATLQVVAAQAVPALGDWCAVDLLVQPRRPTAPGEPAIDWPPEVARLVVAHEDPAKVEWARELERRLPPDWSQPTGLPRVLREGVTEFYPVIDDAMLVAAAESEEHLALLREINFASLIIAPLVSRGKILGALTLCMTDSRRHYDDADRILAEDLASRAAAAIENAALFRDVATANRAKADFLAVMSHELRTPINAMLGYTDLLDAGVAGALGDTQRVYLHRAREAARRLLGHVEDVLMFARLEAGHVVVELAEVPLRELLETVTPIIEPQAASRGLTLQVAGADGLVALTDRDRAVQVLLNLLSNAVKFTPAGGRVRVAAERAGTREIAVHVHDSGPGIPGDKHEAVFEPFVQLDNSHTRRAGGTGLGLAISRDLARAMGGDVTVAAAPGEGGATFSFLLPAAEATPAA